MSMLEHCPSIASDALLRAFRFSNARTYARTHRDLLTLLSYITLVSARRGATRFIHIGAKTTADSRRFARPNANPAIKCDHQESANA